MKNKNFVIGFMFIVLGLIWFFNNLGILSFELRYLIGGIGDLWPLILVVIGVNLLLHNKTIEKLTWVAFLIILIVYSVFNQNNGTLGREYKNIIDNQVYSTVLEQGITEGEVDLKVGGMAFDITSGTSDFVSLNSNTSVLKHNMDVENSKQRIHIYNSGKVLDITDQSNYNFNLSLNETIPWNFDIDCGAVDGSLDLKNINIETLQLDMGAGAIDIDLGNKPIQSRIDINTGVSQITLNIPKESGIKLDFEGGLNSTNFSELDLIQQNNTYISKNYNEATSKYDINVKMGLGQFEIKHD